MLREVNQQTLQRVSEVLAGHLGDAGPSASAIQNVYLDGRAAVADAVYSIVTTGAPMQSLPPSAEGSSRAQPGSCGGGKGRSGAPQPQNKIKSWCVHDLPSSQIISGLKIVGLGPGIFGSRTPEPCEFERSEGKLATGYKLLLGDSLLGSPVS